MTLTEKTGTHY